jgi:hypothetical protein
MPHLEARVYAPDAANRMHIRSRPAAFYAKDYINLAQIHNTLEALIKGSVIGTFKMKTVRKMYLKLGKLRMSMMLPQTIFCVVNMALKNATIATLEGGDDDVYQCYHVNRDQLQQMFESLRAPAILKLPGQHTGTFPTELGFLAWLRYYGNCCKLTDLQKEFGMEYSRINKCLHAFQQWMYDQHGFRYALYFYMSFNDVVTQGHQCMAPLVFPSSLFQFAFASSRSAPAFRIRATMGSRDRCLCGVQFPQTCPNFYFTAWFHVPIAKPSDMMVMRAINNANGVVEVELIETERRFFCVYKWVHGIKFQVVCLPNGMIGNVAGSWLIV